MEKQTYITPELEVIEVKIEQGFAASLQDPTSDYEPTPW